MRNIDHFIIHCSATPADRDISALDIDQWHRAKGWFGCGYHFIIKRDGTLESQASGSRCRPLEKAGAHVGDCGSGWNNRSIGICLIGGVNKKLQPEDNFTEEQFTTLTDLLQTLDDMFKDCTILGHGSLIEQTNGSPKACPSFDVPKFLEINGF